MAKLMLGPLLLSLMVCLTAAFHLDLTRDTVFGEPCVAETGHRSKRSLCSHIPIEIFGKKLDQIRTMFRNSRFLEFGTDGNQFQCPVTGSKFTLVDVDGDEDYVEVTHADVPGYKLRIFKDGYQLLKKTSSGWQVVLLSDESEWARAEEQFPNATMNFRQKKSPMISGTHGRETVAMAIAMVKQSAIWREDHDFLSRIAWVESKFGDDRNTYRTGYNGGIWQVDRVWFQDTKNTVSHPSLRQTHKKVKDKFGIDWPSVEWAELRKPLYSAIAARMGLGTKNGTIPSTVPEQAAYWKSVYNSELGAGSDNKFLTDVNAMESQN